MWTQLFVGFISIFLPGIFLSLALLRKTKMPMFEIVVIGFIFGLIFPPGMTWAEAYLIPYMHFFSYSSSLYNANIVALTIIGIILCFQQGAFAGIVPSADMFKRRSRQDVAKVEESTISDLRKNYNARIRDIRRELAALRIDVSIVRKHQNEEESLQRKGELELQAISDSAEKSRIAELHAERERRLVEIHEREEAELLNAARANAAPKKSSGNMTLVWGILLALMLFSFATRIINISSAPTFFEFDPYYDMQATQYILTYGQQLLYDHSAWPTLVSGTIHRLEPLVPYMEAYWYNLVGGSTVSINTTTLSNVSSFYPPITAALLTFVIFMMLYHDYGGVTALVGAGLAAGMPALVSAFISGEQLLEPWGIFTMFFFTASYLLAVKNPKEKRYTVLAAIAFISAFLGAHYYTVTAGILTVYILLQGLIHVFGKEDMKDFYYMNGLLIGIIAIAYLIYAPYGGALADRIPTLLGIPVIVSFPLAALAFVLVFDYLPKMLSKRRLLFNNADTVAYLATLAGMAVIALLLIAFTPIGNPVKKYIQLSQHFTTPSIPLFMTVQEYMPTGINFDFGAGGFGFIGASIAGVNMIVWAVLLLFSVLALAAILFRRSRSSILYLSTIFPLALAGMLEVKYLPHFGVAYILALCFIIGELMLFVRNNYRFSGAGASPDAGREKIVYMIGGGAALLTILFVGMTAVSVFSAAGQSCNTIAVQNNSLGYNLFCNQVQGYWLDATAWMRQNIGPDAPRVLSWWDYGDWINWFGNSNAVIRGDNSVATLDYRTAANYVFTATEGFGPGSLAQFMNQMQAEYVVFDNQIMQKWQALDFLACIDTNETTQAFATQAGASTGQQYALGTSQCEQSHDPAFMLVPEGINNVNSYCQINGNQTSAIKSLMVYGSTAINETYCVPSSVYSDIQNGASATVPVYYANGTATDMLLSSNSDFFYGAVNLQGTNFLYMFVIYKANGPNSTVVGAPTEFYNSQYYRGFMFGKLPGFTLAYPRDFSGLNAYGNSSSQVMIFRLDNYTGGLPYHTPKPTWLNNTYETPG